MDYVSHGILIGSGLVNWPANERRIDRYGAILLMEDRLASAASWAYPWPD